MPSYVVTGAARGIGLEFVRQISADPGNSVFALVRNKAAATDVKSLPGTNITVLEADITDATALKKAAAAVSNATGGKLDYLINNAAMVTVEGLLLSLPQFKTEEELDNDLLDNYKVNTIGTIRSINTFLPLLRQGAAKKVIAITSASGDVDFVLRAGSRETPGYSMSKAALNVAIATYAVELKDEGFVFLSIDPGVVNTFTSAPSPEVIEYATSMMQRFAQMEPDFKGPIAPEESVKAQLEVIHRWKVEDTGAFVSRRGTKQWF
ncbi:hypothetical protein C8R43DRAFT_1086902 [Mycena crocata]|nr:hypothetical protein C8R43DRAFT_1086902 [Mycena crocata]